MMEQWLAPNAKEMRRAIEEAVQNLDSVEDEVQAEGDYETGARLLRVDYWGIRAATRKRLAEVQFLAPLPGDDWERTLRLAVDDYQKGLQQGANFDHWIAGQFVVLRSVLQLTPETSDGIVDFWWEQAWRSVGPALRSNDPYQKMWAHSTQADLLMVALAEHWVVPGHAPAVPGTVLGELEMMLKAVGGERDCPALWTTFRQFWRWHYWWKTRPEWSVAAASGYEFLWKLVRKKLKVAETVGTL